MEGLEDILIPITGCVMIVLVVYFVHHYRYLTRKAIIEKGGDIKFPERKYKFLELALAIIGLAIGMAFAAMIQSTGMAEKVMGMLTASCILLFGGLGLISAIAIRRKLEKSEE